DGIRDRNVTGVQTCALPISIILRTSPFLRAARSRWDQGFLRRLQTRILLALAPRATALHVLAAHVSPGYLNVLSSFSWKTWESCPSTSYQSPFPGPRAYRPFPVLRACRSPRHHASSASSSSARIQHAAVAGELPSQSYQSRARYENAANRSKFSDCCVQPASLTERSLQCDQFPARRSFPTAREPAPCPASCPAVSSLTPFA